MPAYQEIQQSLQWMEAHLDENLDIAALSDQVHLSMYYYQRLFSRLVGRPVAEYQKLRRVARASEDLLQNGGRILDIALKWGFQSHESFSRAFKDAYGLTPDEYRKNPMPLTHFIIPDLSMMYRMIDEGVPLLAEGVILEVTRRNYSQERLYAGFSLQCPMGRPSIDNPGRLWEFFTPVPRKHLPHLHPQGSEVGISLPGQQEGCFTYFAGCEVTERSDAFLAARRLDGYGDIPEGMQPCYHTLPAGEYAVCTFTAEDFAYLVNNALDKAMGYFFGTWLPNKKLASTSCVELYDERCLRWHPKYSLSEDVPHLLPREPRLSQWSGPEMEIQVGIPSPQS